LQRPANASGVNQVCPFQLTYCRSSSQTGHDGGGIGVSGNWAPHCSQMKMDIGGSGLRFDGGFAKRDHG
jgi:hypothetical protein